MTYDLKDTIVAIASAAGGAERGIVRLSGPRVVEVVRAHYSPRDGDLSSIGRAMCLEGRWQLPARQAWLPTRLYLWPTARSYTRQPTAELHTLGSPPLLERVLEQLCRSGARLARPGEFTLRAFLAGRLDLTQAEAVLGVIDARDQRQLRVALSQLAGGLSTDLQQIREHLLNLCADVEAGLDFVDDDIHLINPAEIERILASAAAGLADVLGRLGSRSRSDRSPRIVLRGKPNTGKSTLWNALLGHDVALVSDTPGTTRDYLEARWQCEGIDCRLIDSAGIDPTLPSPIDQVSQHFAQQVSADADIVVLCLDASRVWEPWEWQELWQHPQPDVIVLNKIDVTPMTLLHSTPISARIEELADMVRFSQSSADEPAAPTRVRELVKLSALTGSGLHRLRQRLVDELERRLADESSLVEATATRCRNSLHDALEAVKRASALVAGDQEQELLAAELRDALDHLGQILGTVYTEDILDRIFHRFCIGK